MVPSYPSCFATLTSSMLRDTAACRAFFRCSRCSTGSRRDSGDEFAGVGRDGADQGTGQRSLAEMHHGEAMGISGIRLLHQQVLPQVFRRFVT